MMVSNMSFGRESIPLPAGALLDDSGRPRKTDDWQPRTALLPLSGLRAPVFKFSRRICAEPRGSTLSC